MKYPYNNSYELPFPAVETIFHNAEEGLRTQTLQALLDTGADGSLMPIKLLQDILAPALTDARIRSHWGEWRDVQLFAVELELIGLDIKIPNLFVVGDEVGEEIILGRDFINKLRLNLDGPATETEIFPQ
jgi:hypothetical protein